MAERVDFSQGASTYDRRHGTVIPPGVRTEEDVEAFLSEEGMPRLETVRLGAGHPMTVGRFLQRLVDGECSYTWAVPKDIAARDHLARLPAHRVSEAGPVLPGPASVRDQKLNVT